jgi:hypothetical protein
LQFFHSNVTTSFREGIRLAKWLLTRLWFIFRVKLGENMLYRAFLLVLLLPTLVFGQAKFDGKDKCAVKDVVWLTLSAELGDDPQFKCFPENKNWRVLKDFDGKPQIFFQPDTNGVFTFAFCTNKDKKTIFVSFDVTVGGKPVDPPSPKPDDPVEPDEKPPIPDPGFKLLIVEESNDRPKLSQGQLGVMFGQTVKAFIRPKGEFLVADKDSDPSNLPKVWQDAIARAKAKATSYPWYLVSNGKKGYEGPLPKDITTPVFLETLKKY